MPQLTSGLLQCARGVNFSSLSHGYGAGITNWAPLIDGQASLADLNAPHMVDFATQLTEAAVRLTISLCGSTSNTTSEELNSKWCSVTYNLLEVLGSGSKKRRVTTAAARLSYLLKSVSCSFFWYSCS